MTLGPAQKAELVDAIYEKFGLPAAAEHCHVKIQDVMMAVDEDKEFADKIDRAMEHLAPLAEQEMIRRAVKGTESYVVSQGRIVMITDKETGLSSPLIERKYSDTLLTKFLESRKREVFGPKVEVSHRHSGFIAVPVMDAAQLQALMDAPGDDVVFLDAEYTELPDTASGIEIAPGTEEDDFPPDPDDGYVPSEQAKAAYLLMGPPTVPDDEPDFGVEGEDETLAGYTETDDEIVSSVQDEWDIL